MVAVTYGIARAAAKAAHGRSLRAFAANAGTLLVRFYNAIIDAQMRRAEREIARHRPYIEANLHKFGLD
jgi:hypothetical protein